MLNLLVKLKHSGPLARYVDRELLNREIPPCNEQRHHCNQAEKAEQTDERSLSAQNFGDALWSINRCRYGNGGHDLKGLYELFNDPELRASGTRVLRDFLWSGEERSANRVFTVRTR